MLNSNLPDLSRQPRRPEPRRTPPQAHSVPAGWHRPAQPRANDPVMVSRSWQRPAPAVHHNATAYRPQATRPVSPVQKKRRKAPLVAVFVAFIFGFVIIHSYVEKGSVTHAISRLTTTAAEKDAAAKQARLETYKAMVNQIIADHPNQNIAVSSIDLSDNSLTSLGDSGTFTGASTAKLITAIAVLHQVELGTITLNDDLNGTSVQTLLQNMIVSSDNDAWLTLNTYITHETLKSYMSRLGWTDYDPDVNTFLPADMARLMEQFYEGKLLDTSNTQLLLGLMRQASKTEYIVSDIQAAGSQYTVYHKAGWLDGLMHDVAIISNGKQTIVLTIYTYSSGARGDSASTQATFKQITGAALTAYFPAT